MRTVIGAVAAGLVLNGCALPCDAVVPGDHVCLEVDTQVEWAQDHAQLARLAQGELELAAEHFGGSFASLDGWTLRLVDGRVHCFFTESVLGCADPFSKTITVSTSMTLDGRVARCLGATSLAHEVGHVVLGGPTYDVAHQSSRWDTQSEWDSLSSRLMVYEGATDGQNDGCAFDLAAAAQYVWPKSDQL